MKSILIPLVPAAMLVFALVVAQPNLSTTIALGIIVGALLWFGGLPLKLFGSIAVTGVVVAGVLAMTAGYRSDRVQAFFNKSDDLQGNNYQAKQALYSLADGGLFRTRTRSERRQVELPTQRAQRLHLRDHRRRVGICRLRSGDRFVRCIRLHGIADRSPQYRSVLAAPVGHCNYLDRRPGNDQHRLRSSDCCR